MSTIFISIAAYRDPELIPTIEDALAKARWPDRLRFGICWQHGENEPALPALDGDRMRLLDVPWRESRGACWARAECMKLWRGEDWFLQLDSHHRFAEHWDEILLDQAARSGSDKPVISAYLPSYEPGSPTPASEAPTFMRFDRFTPEGITLYQFGSVAAPPDGRPLRARFVSGHMLFAPGRFVRDVPYDPDLYFIGEEITLAIRAFTHGYDLFHPGRHVAWHEYTRKNRPKHWDDHQPDRGVEKPWHDRDAASLAKCREFLAAPEEGPFGVGTVRTLADYEEYSGVSFRRRLVSRAARKGEEPDPPVTRLPPEHWTVRLSLDRAALPPEALAQPLFWYVGFHDAEGQEIARDDAARAELGAAVRGEGSTILIERQFDSSRPPARWTVWPTDRRGRWLERIDGPIDASSSSDHVIQVVVPMTPVECL